LRRQASLKAILFLRSDEVCSSGPAVNASTLYGTASQSHAARLRVSLAATPFPYFVSQSLRRERVKISVSAILFMFTTLNALVATAQTLKGAQKDVVSTRELERINWMEFKEVVPSKIQTVLLPTGTLEPHGVINNGADKAHPCEPAQAGLASKDARAPGERLHACARRNKS
jgi:hypothetical protein